MSKAALLKKVSVSLFLLVVIGFGVTAGGALAGPTIEAYEVYVKPIVDQQYFQVTMSIKLTADSIPDTLSLTQNSYIRILGIRLIGSGEPIDLNFLQKEPDTLDIFGFDISSVPRSITLEMAFAVPVGPFNTDFKIVNTGHGWFPRLPGQAARVKVTADVPPKIRFISVGDLIDEQTSDTLTRVSFESRLPVRDIPLIFLDAERYKETVGYAGEVKIQLLVANIAKGIADDVMARCGDVTEYFDNIIGPYFQKQVTIVEVPGVKRVDIAGGLIMMGSIFLHEAKSHKYDVLDMALARLWFGGAVNSAHGEKAALFFTTSVPHYLRLMYTRETEGDEVFKQKMQRLLGPYVDIAGTPLDMPILEIRDIDSREKGRAIFGKGPFVVDRLVKQIGSDNWVKMIHHIYRDFKGSNFTYDNFIYYLSWYDPDGTTVAMVEGMLSMSGLPE